MKQSPGNIHFQMKYIFVNQKLKQIDARNFSQPHPIGQEYKKNKMIWIKSLAQRNTAHDG
jgi:hypothetical protein